MTSTFARCLRLFLLPLVSTATSFLSMKVSLATNRMNNKVQNEQAARIARLRRCLGYELLGQVVIEIIGTHGYLAFLSG